MSLETTQELREMLERKKIEVGIKETNALMNVLRLIEDIRDPIGSARVVCEDEGNSTSWALTSVLDALKRPGARRR